MKISNKAIWSSIIVCLLGGAACKTAPARPDWAGENVALGADMQARFGKVRGWGGSLYVMF